MKDIPHFLWWLAKSLRYVWLLVAFVIGQFILAKLLEPQLELTETDIFWGLDTFGKALMQSFFILMVAVVLLGGIYVFFHISWQLYRQDYPARKRKNHDA